MKLDLHCHTMKCKKGDAISRNVTKEKFIEKVNSAGVEIVAITNHNKFDYQQYLEFQNEDFMVWPGIELDVKGNDSLGHVILIVDSDQVVLFNDYLLNLIDVSPDDYQIDILDFAILAKKFNSIVICHYNKNPQLSKNDISLLKDKLDNTPLYLEPSNLMSVGIFLAHNLNSIIGSDVHDWEKYDSLSFPELKIRIDSFKQFKLLIQKNPEVIKTFIDTKINKLINITPFESLEESLSFNIYNDVNVLIGGKGTGKTKILKAIEKKFELEQNNSISSYFANDVRETFDKQLRTGLSEEDYSKIDCDQCVNDFKVINDFKKSDIATPYDYKSWVKTKNNKNSFAFVNATFENIFKLDSLNKIIDEFKNTIESINKILNQKLEDYLDDNEVKFLNQIFTKLINKLRKKVIDEFSKTYSIKLQHFTIDKMKTLYQNKKGVGIKPNCIGLLSTYNSLRNLKQSVNKIVNFYTSFEQKIYSFIGQLPEKGDVSIKKILLLDPTRSEFKSSHNVVKEDLKKIYKMFTSINNNIFKDDITGELSDLNNLLKKNNINKINDLILYTVYPILSNNLGERRYTPSSGEKAMLIINNALFKNKDIYILDEPEMSVGHDYINNVIVPQIIALAKKGKTLVISTHDANIAVRTLPFVTIYRIVDGDDKKTYYGSPFNDYMINITDDTDKILWADTCMNILEGGKIAFRERGNSYGE